jgi:hypothetical protein
VKEGMGKDAEGAGARKARTAAAGAAAIAVRAARARAARLAPPPPQLHIVVVGNGGCTQKMAKCVCVFGCTDNPVSALESKDPVAQG